MAQVSGPNHSHLLYVRDCNSGRKLLVDTGAQISVFPASALERRRPKTEPLVATNGSKIDTFGSRAISLDLGFRKFTWSFVLADVNRPMLGADFFCSNHLLIDVYTSHIIDATTYESVPVWHDDTPAPGLNACTAVSLQTFSRSSLQSHILSSPRAMSNTVFNIVSPLQDPQCMLRHAAYPLKS